MDVVGVDHGDDQQRHDVVDHEHGQQERADPVGDVVPDQDEEAQRQGRVGRHRDAPAVGAGAAGVDREVERDRHHHAEEAGSDGQEEPAAVPQVAEVDLAPRLQADDEEEEGHQAAVDPGPQVAGDAVVAEAEAERRRPEPLVGVADVGPQERDDDRGDEDARTAGLGLQERPHRGRELAPSPRGCADLRPRPTRPSSRLLSLVLGRSRRPVTPQRRCRRSLPRWQRRANRGSRVGIPVTCSLSSHSRSAASGSRARGEQPVTCGAPYHSPSPDGPTYVEPREVGGRSHQDR